MNFCKMILQFVNDGKIKLHLIFFSNKALFHLLVQVKEYNRWHKTSHNPRLIYKLPLCGSKIFVQCTANADRKIILIFFNDTIHSERCMDQILPHCLAPNRWILVYILPIKLCYYSHSKDIRKYAQGSAAELQVICDKCKHNPDLNPCDSYLLAIKNV